MKDREATGAIRELAERQHGVVARRQLLALGVARSLIQGRVEAGLLVPVFQGVFALGHRHVSRRGQMMTAVLASGPGAVLSHGSAMELWGVRGARGPIEVLRRSGGPRSVRREIRLHQTRSLPHGHITRKEKIPVTTVERTFLDMAGRLDAKQQERALVEGDRSGVVRWHELQKMIRGWRGKKGIGRLRRVAMGVDPRAIDTKSSLEVDFLALCREFGISLPQVNVFVGPHLVDFLWPEQRVVVETDGYAYHRDRPSFESDHRRTVALAAADYEVHRATHRMLAWDPDPFMNLVRRSLQRHTQSRTRA